MAILFNYELLCVQPLIQYDTSGKQNWIWSIHHLVEIFENNLMFTGKADYFNV